MMKRSIIIIGLLWLSYSLAAQYAEDALRFSQQYYQGSARFMAAGGAFGGLGGDFSVLSTNPGGIGIFRTSEAILTPSVTSRKVTSLYDFDGSLRDDNRTVFALNNFGYVNAKKLGRGGKGWKYFQYAIGMNRLNNYNTDTYMQGENQSSSRVDTYIDDAVDYLNDGGTYDNLIYHDPFYVGPAWETFLLDTISDENYTYLISPVPAGGMLQTQRIETWGSTNEWFGSVGANFNDILYIGATLGFPYIRYYRNSYYVEKDVANSETFDNWSVSESLETKGMGINFKIGAIVRPLDWLRIGAAFHTPSYYWSLTDAWYTYTTSDVYAFSLDEWVISDYNSVIGEYDYKLTTPMRFIGDLAFVIKKNGFISAEYEYADYSQAKFKANDYDFASANADINTYYTSTHNLRAGAEWRVSSLSLRAGYALYSSPYKNSINDGARQSYSGGLGYRGNLFSIDFAYVYSKMSEDYYLYIYTDPNTGDDISPKVTNELTESSFILSFKYYLK